MREAAHIACALDVVLATKRINTDTPAANIAGRHRQVCDGHNGRAALGMFGDTEAVIDRSIATGGIKPRGCAKLFGVHQRYRLQIFGAIAGLRNELGPMAIFVPVATLPNECLIGQTFGDDDMGHRRQHGNIRAGAKRKMVLRLDMRRTDNVGAARVDDD